MTTAQSATEMAPVVVDTDVVYYLFKQDTRAFRYRPHLSGRLCVISFMTLAELAFWAEERRWGPLTRDRLRRFLTRFTVHYPDSDLCDLWAVLTVAARQRGRQIGSGDAWVAATAVRHDVPLVTHNAADFIGVPGLTVVSEPDP